MSSTAVPVDPSTRRLSEVARHVVVPEGIVDTLWFDLEDLFAEWGDDFDAWQDGLGQFVLGLRDDGYFAATVGGVTISIPRQVAKTFIVGRIVFALCAKFPGTTVLWTAHRTRTATQTFEKLKGFARRPAVRAHLAKGRNNGLRDSHGEQEIRFANESVIMFGAREQGFGRGFDEVDVEVFDEAQILTEKALEDMVAATNQSRFPHGALLFFMGTPPRPTDPGEEFRNRRSKALAAKVEGEVFAESGDAMYVECSADSDVGKPGGPSLDDVAQVMKANPSYPHRTPPMSVARLRENLTSDDSWRREGLGVWDEKAQHKALITAERWEGLNAHGPALDARPSALAIDMSHDRVLAVAACWGGEQSHVELVAVDRLADPATVTSWLVARAGRKIPVVVDGMSPAASLVPALKAARVNVALTGASDMAKACGLFFDEANAPWQRLEDRRLTHADQEHLAAAVAAAVKRPIGQAGGWGLDRRSPDSNIAPLVAAVLARYGALATRRTGKVW